MVHVPSRGWKFWVVHPDTDRVLTTDPRSDPNYPPAVNTLPRIQIPVPKSDHWLDLKDENEVTDIEPEMWVYYDGQRLPIEELERVEEQDDRVVLHGVGGVELRDVVEVEYGRGEVVDDEAESLVTSNTSYATDFDEPVTQTFTGQTIQDLTTQGDYRRARAGPLPNTKPIRFNSSGQIELLQSGFFERGSSDLEGSNGASFVTTSGYSDGGAYRIDQTGDYVEYEFGPLDYDMPGTDFTPLRIGWAYSWRIQPEDGNNLPEVTVTLSGDDGFEHTIEVLDGDWTSTTSGSWAWNLTGSSDGDPDLSEGTTYTIRFEITEATGSNHYLDVDAVWFGDNKYSYNFDNSVASNGDPLDGPEEYPDEETVTFADAETLHGVTEVDEVALTINDTTGNQGIEVSGDGGKTWDEQTNTATHTGVTFASTEVSAKVRLSLSRYGSGGSSSPATGFNGQVVSDLTMTADLEDLAFIIRQDYEERLDSILTTLADLADSLWEVTVNDAGNITIAWAQKGQRTNDDAPPVSDFEYTRSTERLIEKAVVYGHSRSVSDERFTSNHGSAVELRHSNLVQTRETVYDPTTEEVFEKEQDYDFDYQNGEITTVSGGRMSDSTEYAIDYEWKIRGEYDSGVSNPRTESIDIPQLTTIRGCRQVAYLLVQEFNTASEPAKVTIPRTDPTISVIESIDLAQIPGGSALHIRRAPASPGETELQLDNRERIEDFKSDIQARLRGVEKRS